MNLPTCEASHGKAKFPLLILLFLLVYSTMAFSTTRPTLEYLGGVHRLNNTGYSDFYFCCNVVGGTFLQWRVNSERLSIFAVRDAGRVIVGERSKYEYTATLLSSRRQEDANEIILDSILMVSFINVTENEFEITCSSTIGNSDDNSSRIVHEMDSTRHNSTVHNEVFLDYVLSRQVLKNDTRYTHIFVCGTTVMQQFFEVQGAPIGFGRQDRIGQSRTVLSHDGRIVNVQGILMARQPYRSTSILFVSDYSDVTISCFVGTNKVQLTSQSSNNENSSNRATTGTKSSSDLLASTPSMLTSSKEMAPRNTQGSKKVYLVTAVVFSVIIVSLVVITMGFVYMFYFISKKRRSKSHSLETSSTQASAEGSSCSLETSSTQASAEGSSCSLETSSTQASAEGSSKDGHSDQMRETESEPLIVNSTSSSCSESAPATFEWESDCQPRWGRSISCPMTEKEWPSRPTRSSFSEIEEDVGKVYVSNIGLLHIGGGLRHRTRTTVEETEYVQPTTTNYTTKKDKSFLKNTVDMFNAEQECDISPEEKLQPTTTDPSVEHFYGSICEAGEFARQKFMGPVWRDKLEHVINSITRVLDTYKSPIPMDMLLSGTHSSMFQTFRIADEVTLMRELSNLGGVMDSVGFDMENSLMSAWCAKFLDAPMSGIQNLQFFNALFQEPPMKCTPETSKDVNLTLLEVLEIMKDDFQARQAMQLLCDLDACSWKENKAMYRISPASQLTQR